MTPYRNDAHKNKLRRFWSTFISALDFIFVLAALLCMVYIVYAAIYSVGTPTYSDAGKSSPKATPSDEHGAGPSARSDVHTGTGHPPSGKRL